MTVNRRGSPIASREEFLNCLAPRSGACALLALALISCPLLRAEIRSLTILHTNDLHARISPLDNRHGGFAYLAAVITRERAGCLDCILLNAGDLVQGKSRPYPVKVAMKRRIIPAFPPIWRTPAGSC